MPTVNDIYEYIDSIAPFADRLPDDNAGLLVGDPDREVKTLCACLDVTRDTLDAAKKLCAELIVCHHPVIFRPQNRFLAGDLPFELAATGISAICAHTSLDCATGGVNDVLADIFGLVNVEPVTTSGESVPIVRGGTLARRMTPPEFAGFAAQKLGASVRWCDGGKPVERIALAGGGGGFLAGEIADMGFDALVTGDAKYHDFLTAAHKGLTLVAAGHFETESPAMPVLAEKLQARFPEVSVKVLSETNVIQYL
ncbi:MAG: Nif3-like dinuclear metal center hexameric protein [Oscillospiraceae bacterium]|nr:Nif3-like dinuclear metal center hexameric protein [Oscillospiraceae bacterium]